MVRKGGMVSWVDLTEASVFYFEIISKFSPIRHAINFAGEGPFFGHTIDREVA